MTFHGQFPSIEQVLGEPNTSKNDSNGEKTQKTKKKETVKKPPKVRVQKPKVEKKDVTKKCKNNKKVAEVFKLITHPVVEKINVNAMFLPNSTKYCVVLKQNSNIIYMDFNQAPNVVSDIFKLTLNSNLI